MPNAARRRCPRIPIITPSSTLIRRRVAGWSLCLALAVGACASPSPRPVDEAEAAQPPPGTEIDRVEAPLALGGATTLVVDNPFGDLHLRAQGSEGPSATLFVQQPVRGRATVRWALSREGERMFATVARETPTAPLRVDAVLLVPPEVSLRLYTDDGAIDAKGLPNPRIQARTRDGDIRLIGASRMHARTEGGTIRATFTTPGWADVQRLESETGSIEAYVPLHGRLAVDARTAGDITSEWRAGVTREGAVRRLEYRQGGGEDAVMVRSRSGDIGLYELIAAGR